jgi:hypothetical protein
MTEVNLKWMNLVVSGLMRSFGYVVGIEQLKMFVSKAGEAMIGMAEEEGGKPPIGKSITEIVQSTGDSVKSMNPGQIDWNAESADNGTKLTIKTCPFSHLCSTMFGEIISGGRIEKEKIPCIMAEIASGACRNLDKKTRATLDTFAPGMNCTSIVLDLEV